MPLRPLSVTLVLVTVAGACAARSASTKNPPKTAYTKTTTIPRTQEVPRAEPSSVDDRALERLRFLDGCWGDQDDDSGVDICWKRVDRAWAGSLVWWGDIKDPTNVDLRITAGQTLRLESHCNKGHRFGDSRDTTLRLETLSENQVTFDGEKTRLEMQVDPAEHLLVLRVATPQQKGFEKRLCQPSCGSIRPELLQQDDDPLVR